MFPVASDVACSPALFYIERGLCLDGKGNTTTPILIHLETLLAELTMMAGRNMDVDPPVFEHRAPGTAVDPIVVEQSEDAQVSQ